MPSISATRSSLLIPTTRASSVRYWTKQDRHFETDLRLLKWSNWDAGDNFQALPNTHGLDRHFINPIKARGVESRMFFSIKKCRFDWWLKGGSKSVIRSSCGKQKVYSLFVTVLDGTMVWSILILLACGILSYLYNSIVVLVTWQPLYTHEIILLYIWCTT